MSHAIRRLSIAACFAALTLFPGLSLAASTVKLMDGVGLIDYGRKPSFEVGSWVKYQVKGHSDAGAVDDYTITVLIAGEETFWGEDCFWVETLTEDAHAGPRVVATLVSYAIFDDPTPILNLQFFLRKFLDGFDADGNPVERVPKTPRGSPQRRTVHRDGQYWEMDTLGTEEMTVPKGTYLCRKIAIRELTGATTDEGDSSIRNETEETRHAFMSSKIPITSLVREDMEQKLVRKSWKLGQSKDTRTRFEDVATGTSVLLDFGKGMPPQLVPASLQSIRRGKPPTSAGTKSNPPKKKSG